ncbi:MAG: hypothetical protein ABI809_12065 [Caldimonas sp.]
MAIYTITSIDNASVGTGARSVKRGEYGDADQAIACAQRLVSEALLEHFLDARDENDLMARYMTSGREVPMIYGEPRAEFHAYRYARQRAGELFAEKRSLVRPPL